jgi:acyl carrier protein
VENNTAESPSRPTGSSRDVPALSEIEVTIQTFVRTYILDEEYPGADPLAELEIDSLALEQLLDHLEETYRLLFDPEDISRDNLSSVARAAEMVHARITSVAAGKLMW